MNFDTEFKPERIIMLRNMLQLSQVNFANKIHISQGALSQIENGKSQISLETLRNISRELNVNCNWLVNGMGDIFLTEDDGKQTSKKSETVSVKATGAGRPFIPYIRSKSQKQYTKKYKNVDFIKEMDLFYLPGFEKGDIRMFDIVDEAMSPLLNPGEIVITELAHDHTSIDNGALALALTKDGLMVRSIHFFENDHNILVLKSPSRKFKNQHVHVDELKEIWLIRSKITSGFTNAGSLDAKRIEKLESGVNSLRRELKKLLQG